MPIVTTPSDPVGATAETWQRHMKDAIRSPQELLQAVGLPIDDLDGLCQAARSFSVFAPRPFIAKIERSRADDPLLRQIMPSTQELKAWVGFGSDPVGDGPAQISPGVLKKYQRRALLITNGVCAINCRFCFRRHFPYSESRLSDWRDAIQTIDRDSSIDEVILSGGDPLTLVDGQLEHLVRALESVPHLRRLRIHTRLPIVIPERITDRFLRLLGCGRLTPYFVVQTNHPRELDGPVLDSLGRLIMAGVPVLSQTVLLKGINDNASTLAALMLRLVDHRVMPYYLHQLDRVDGAGHFDVSIEKGKQIMQALREDLPGYAVPRYVRELPGRKSKTPVELEV